MSGIGVVSSVGIGVEAFWSAIVAGQSGITPISSFDASSFGCRVGGEVKGFDPEGMLGRDRARSLGRTTQLAVTASSLALADAGLDGGALEQGAVGLAVGSGMGEAQTIEQACRARRAGTTLIGADRRYPFAAIVRGLLEAQPLRGPVALFTTACAAGNFAIAHGYDAVASGVVDVAIAGGVDAMSYIAFAGFARIFSLAPRCCQPFDKGRKGILVGEGAAFLVLEEREHARRRGAATYAKVAGYGMSCDAHHITAPDPSGRGIDQALRGALADAGVGCGEVQYISAHGTGTILNDRTETACIRKVFGANAEALAVSATKSMLGHTGGAASAIEAAVCCLAVENDVAPPTINHEVPDPECDLDCVPNVAQRRTIDVALNNAFAFGGNNCCVVFRKDEAPHA